MPIAVHVSGRLPGVLLFLPCLGLNKHIYQDYQGERPHVISGEVAVLTGKEAKFAVSPCFVLWKNLDLQNVLFCHIFVIHFLWIFKVLDF